MGDTVIGQGYRKATFAAGCFWGVEEAFRKTSGVVSTRVGYTGGRLKNPAYRDVCSGMTGHAEAVEITYDPDLVSYEELLTVFFRIHDPTTKDRQGPDVGSQYRSVIFFHDESQRQESRSFIDELIKSGRYRGPVVTEVVPAAEFYEAEEYHQHYLVKNKEYSCRFT